MGRLFKEYCNSSDFYVCAFCMTHLTDKSDVISNSFRGKLGRAFLLKKIINAIETPSRKAIFTSGEYTVSDLYCRECNQYLGWKYKDTKISTMKGKIDKVLLEEHSSFQGYQFTQIF